MRLTFKILSIFLIFLFIGISGANHLAADENEDDLSLSITEPIYVFSDHLEEAIAIVRVDAEEVAGKWTTDRFEFEKLSDRHDVLVKEGVFAGKKKTGIYFIPVRNGIKRLTFNGIPGGNNILLEYGIEDKGVEELQESGTVYLRIWLGKHLLKRIVVANEKGWFQEVFDLGAVAYLNQPIAVTFQVSSDTIQGRYFYFRATTY